MARAKRFLIPPGPKKPLLGKPPFSRPSLSWVLRRAFMSPAEGGRCMRRDEKQGDRPSDCVLGGCPSFTGGMLTLVRRRVVRGVSISFMRLKPLSLEVTLNSVKRVGRW